MVTKQQLSQFNATRSISDTTTLCHAPWLSMNFDQSGEVTACCFNRTYVLGAYPQQSIADIWQGKKATALRKAMKEERFNLGCQRCEKMIEEGNFESVLIKQFDNYVDFLPPVKENYSLLGKLLPFLNAPQVAPPTVFEFELSNTCNLECIMCGGHWSSAIRSNREKQPALKSPYDSAFVKQVRDFLPGLRRANFLGGEPFLISLYYEIWESIIELNPAIDVAITSNGTTLNDRAKKIIDKLPNCRITLSIDSLRPQTWEQIRVNGKFEVLKKNLDYLLQTGKLVSFSVCPIIQNRMEIPEIISFCVEHKLSVFFNTVFEPLGGRITGIHQNPVYPPIGDLQLPVIMPETSLQFLPAQQLEELIAYYQTFTFTGNYQVQLNSLIEQLKAWKNVQQPQYAE